MVVPTARLAACGCDGDSCWVSAWLACSCACKACSWATVLATDRTFGVLEVVVVEVVAVVVESNFRVKLDMELAEPMEEEEAAFSTSYVALNDRRNRYCVLAKNTKMTASANRMGCPRNYNNDAMLCVCYGNQDKDYKCRSLIATRFVDSCVLVALMSELWFCAR